MALVISGKSKCPICGEVILLGDARTLFPSFVPNDLDPLAIFNDAGFHARCVKDSSLGEQALRLSTELVRRAGPDGRRCEVCGRTILDPDDYFAIPFITNNPLLAAFQFNFMQFHKSHLPSWGERHRFLEVIENLVRSNEWSPMHVLNRLLELCRDVR
jgi:hypothetical protein